jgi:hypothetical protein
MSMGFTLYLRRNGEARKAASIDVCRDTRSLMGELPLPGHCRGSTCLVGMISECARELATENAPATPTRKVAENELSQPEVLGLQPARARARLSPERERLKWSKGRIRA